MRGKIIVCVFLLLSPFYGMYGYTAEGKSIGRVRSSGDIWAGGRPDVKEEQEGKGNRLFSSVKQEGSLLFNDEEDPSLSAPPPGVTDPPQKVPLGRQEMMVYVMLCLGTFTVYTLKGKR
ncbi:MAG: hypothetical protein LUG18_15860 [Candidatus Azobacteroides sp.]|nr:hypothetical protein [Candidatus Azobacteroides sp.]